MLYTLPCMQRAHWKLGSWTGWGSAVLSAALLELPFPLAGPLPLWRTVFAWFGLVPLLAALFWPAGIDQPRPLCRAFLMSYLCGFLWYMGNCYWIRDTMMRYGDMPPLAPFLLLVGFSLVLGLYFAVFGWVVMLIRQATGSTRKALAAAPFLWVALELAAARITSVPWDQLGYSQVDNQLVNQFAPWTGVYGISFVLVLVSALIAGGLVLKPCEGRRWCGVVGVALMAIGTAGVFLTPTRQATAATAVLIQPNLDVGADNDWNRAGEWEQNIAQFIQLGNEQCKSYIAGIPETGAANGAIVCPPYLTHPDLVVWPESPAPFFEGEPRFQQAMAQIAHAEQAPLVVGDVGMDYSAEQSAWIDHVSAEVVSADGNRVGRYDKIHLVPFGEYVPFARLLFFAHKLTGRVSAFTPGEKRKVFRLKDGHRYGVFICYESVFADEVRQFAQLGAEVLVNISDDGWYGDTSAPWQHLNMARMRAVENRRWILRDTNSGVTSVIDPNGVVRQSIPRHVVDALPAAYGFRDDMTFYTAHGDVFAWACALVGLGLGGGAAKRILKISRGSSASVRA
jgi:apolipoprotein N-acyltransferase